MSKLVALMAIAIVLPASIAAGPPAGGEIDPGNFVGKVDNPWYPLRPGTTYVFRGVEQGQPSRDVVSVTSRTKTIAGVRCVVVSDNVYLSGRLAERTTDWYAQDRKGDVWYFGEATAELDSEGHVRTTEGSWQAGVDGALPGIVMPAHPSVGQSFRQEYYRGHAEDHFKILSLSAEVAVPFISSTRAMLTKEWTPLEPGHAEHKYYIRGLGLVRDGVATLVDVRR